MHGENDFRPRGKPREHENSVEGKTRNSLVGALVAALPYWARPNSRVISVVALILRFILIIAIALQGATKNTIKRLWSLSIEESFVQVGLSIFSKIQMVFQDRRSWSWEASRLRSSLMTKSTSLLVQSIGRSVHSRCSRRRRSSLIDPCHGGRNMVEAWLFYRYAMNATRTSVRYTYRHFSSFYPAQESGMQRTPPSTLWPC